jgi:hypothetical protein
MTDETLVDNTGNTSIIITEEPTVTSATLITPLTPLAPMIQIVPEAPMTPSSVTSNTVATGTLVTPVTANTTIIANSTVVMASVPSSMVDGTLTNMDNSIAATKALLDADILAAQIKAKSAVSVFVTTAEAALADIKTWVEETPGEIQVVKSTVSKVLQDIKIAEEKVITVVDNVGNVIVDGVDIGIKGVKAVDNVVVSGVETVGGGAKVLGGGVKSVVKPIPSFLTKSATIVEDVGEDIVVDVKDTVGFFGRIGKWWKNL